MKTEAQLYEADPATPAGPPRVLIVEDHKHTASLLEFMLERAGFAVQIARDGNAALQAIADAAPCDIVLLDLMLPYASGLQVLQAIRANGRWMDVPVIVVSAKALEQDVTQAFDAGANDYVTKPFMPGALIARIRHALEVSRRLQAGTR